LTQHLTNKEEVHSVIPLDDFDIAAELFSGNSEHVGLVRFKHTDKIYVMKAINKCFIDENNLRQRIVSNASSPSPVGVPEPDIVHVVMDRLPDDRSMIRIIECMGEDIHQECE
jgi:hypothetical protein